MMVDNSKSGRKVQAWQFQSIRRFILSFIVIRYLRANKIDRALSYVIGELQRSGSPIPTPNTSIILNLLFAEISGLTDRIDVSLSAIKVIIGQIECNFLGGDEPYLTDDDLSYVAHRAKLILMSLTNYVDSEAFDMVLNIDVTYDHIKFDRVSPILKILFPINKDAATEMDEKVRMNAPIRR